MWRDPQLEAVDFIDGTLSVIKLYVRPIVTMPARDRRITRQTAAHPQSGAVLESECPSAFCDCEISQWRQRHPC